MAREQIRLKRNSIDERVLIEWCRTLRAIAKERGDNVEIVQPFHPFEQSYGEIVRGVRRKSHQGMNFYERMVRELNIGYATPKYVFED